MKCGAKNRQGEPCQRWALAGRSRCRLHGGKTLVGPASPSYRSGRYSSYLPERLRERYETAKHDIELLSLRDELALVDSRLADLLSRVDSGENGQLWTDLKRAHRAFKVAKRGADVARMHTTLARVEQLLDSAVDDHQAWAEIAELLEQRRRLAESEQKRLIALEQMLTAEQAMALVSRVVDIVGRHVRDREAMSAIVVEMRALAEVTSGRPVYGGAPDA